MIVRLEHVDFYYKGKTIFRDAGFGIEHSGIYGVIAPNGFGKTTLLNLIAGQLVSKKGGIFVHEQPITPKIIFESICFLHDSSVLYDSLSGLDHLLFFCDQRKIPRSEIIVVAEFLNITSYYKKKVESYSLGMKQRVLLALALLSKEPILLLDEPLNGLDPTSTILIREAITKMANEGKTVLVSSHNLDEMDKLTTKILFIKEQKIWMEDLKHYQKQVMKLTIAPKETQRLTAIFQQHALKYFQEKQSFTLYLSESSSVRILNLLIREGIEMTEFEQWTTGSEQRYKELYEGY